MYGYYEHVLLLLLFIVMQNQSTGTGLYEEGTGNDL
jgi:hypothetical protein